MKILKRLKNLSSKKFPLIKIDLKNLYNLGGQFYLWEFATAVMGAVLGINPFDEPNVKESKDNTAKVLEYFEAEKKLPVQTPNAFKNNLKIYLDINLFKKKLSKKKILSWDFDDYLSFFLNQSKRFDYVAIMAYIQNNETNEKLLQKIRDLIKTRKRLATTVGYGPRFLHSTGQLHKGGPDEGIFIQIISDDSKDLQIPGKPYSFSILKQAQALGDYESLLKWKKKVLKINLGSSISKGLEEFYLRLKKVI